MISCPSCHRPVAVARPSCLYCGKPLPPELVPAVAPLARPEPGTAGGDASASARLLLVLDLAGARPEALVQALGLPSYEAELLSKRGGYRFHRALEPARAEQERERLLAHGVTLVLVPEDEARLPPLRVRGGGRSQHGLHLRTEEGPLDVRPGDLLLVVQGTIAREYQTSLRRQRLRTARLEDGYRVHLHRLAETRPLEIDAFNFERGAAFTESVRIEVDACVDAVSPGVPRDDEFRRLSPALGPAEEEPRGPLSAVGSLRAGAERPPSPTTKMVAAGADPDADRTAILDNVRQFRFYSGWRAAVERRRERPGPG
jgi:hypothetical protein